MRIIRGLFAALAAAALLPSLAAAQAAPGTLVTNTIDLSYTSGGNTVSRPSAATTTFAVDRKIDLNVDPLNAGGIVYAEQAQDDVVLSFLVQNLGNDRAGYDLDVVTSGTLGLTYAPNGGTADGTWYVIVSDNPTPGAGSEAIYDINGLVNATDLLANGRFWVHIHANVADSATDGQSLTFDVTARTLVFGTNTLATEERNRGLNGVDTVFSDPGVDGRESASENLVIQAPDLTASKSVVVISENLAGTFNCASGAPVAGAEAAIPGACLEYTITVSNGAGAALPATSLRITDPLPNGVTYASHSRGTFDSVTRSGSTLTGNLASLSPGSAASFTIRATVQD